ncbi:hypothetical protein L211DRAFT_309217 [Terfezia boudieri ATCC MYA-4762]|uniref:Protein DOM34 homolog n=1 Tax=Terfezia boudieri ATCC MYA-4762 TaxID=1051890 RepID=A0A3N4LJ09_9PEZI|nr:hypothetical protein L211DRAFT_309217 [Terfezia boudieri ATCC MYA-4762]
MKVIKNLVDRDGNGSITLFPEEPEDMWHTYNLLTLGDHLTASAIRKVSTESSTGSTSTHRVHTTLTTTITSIDFDPPSSTLHINGRVITENKHVKLGSYHTLDLELNRNFTITKPNGGWDSVAMQVIRDACDPAEKAEIGAVVMQEGLANVCLVTEYMTVLRQRVDVSLPRKRRGVAMVSFDKGMERFYEQVYQAILKHLPIESLKVVLLASPGFLADGLMKYIFAKATTAGNIPLLRSRPKFITAHTSSGHIHSLSELLASQEIQARLTNTRFLKESRAIDEFYAMMTTDEDRAWYGISEVEKAVGKGAVQTLLISNSLMRSQTVVERRRYVRMVEEVKGNGGEALVLSSVHESGRRLDGLGGVAAILGFPLLGLDEDENEEEAEEEEEGQRLEKEANGEGAVNGVNGTEVVKVKV